MGDHRKQRIFELADMITGLPATFVLPYLKVYSLNNL